MGRPPDDDDDYSIQLTPYPQGGKPTIELETSDLVNMEQSGVAQAKPNLVIQLGGGKTVELQPGWSQQREASRVVVDPTPSVIVETDEPAAACVQRLAPTAVRDTVPRRAGVWLVVVVYALATTALGLAIYERFIA